MAIKDFIDDLKLRHYHKKVTRDLKKAGVTSVDELYGGKPVEKPEISTLGAMVKRLKAFRHWRAMAKKSIKAGYGVKMPSSLQTEIYLRKLRKQSKRFMKDIMNESSDKKN